MRKRKHPYKEPIFLFTSSSMRQAAWAGWHSAMGDQELAEKYVHAAQSEWLKELGAGRKHAFLGYHNCDIWEFIPEKRLKEIIDNLLKTLKAEIKKHKNDTIARPLARTSKK